MCRTAMSMLVADTLAEMGPAAAEPPPAYVVIVVKWFAVHRPARAVTAVEGLPERVVEVLRREAQPSEPERRRRVEPVDAKARIVCQIVSCSRARLPVIGTPLPQSPNFARHLYELVAW